jgi:hypothetical protein
VTDDAVAVVVEVHGVPADGRDVHGQVDDVQPHRVGRERAVGHAHAARVQAVADLGRVRGGRAQLPHAGGACQVDPVHALVRARDEQHPLLHADDPAFDEVRVHLARGRRVPLRARRLGGERAERAGPDDGRHGGTAEHRAAEELPAAQRVHVLSLLSCGS